VKYLVLIGDGMSDLPLKELNNKTPLEAAKTPNMDFLAQNGVCGWVNNVPAGMQPGSDTANMSIMGYDPKKYLVGRGPFEAASLGVKLKAGEVAFRCNLVTVKDGKMKDFTAGHISTKEATRIMKMLDSKLGGQEIKFYPGLSYRHLLVMSNDKCQMTNVKTTPPHDITGQKIGKYLPKGKGSEVLIQLMNEAEVVLHDMKTKANMIWPWGQGPKPSMPSFQKKYHKKAAMITAVHLLKGIARVLGMDNIDVPGATGYLDTNYRGKAEYAFKALKNHDVVFVHVEAPDEAGHEGSVEKKIKSIEDFDRLVVGTILKDSKLQKTNYQLLILPDHPTPIIKMTHTADAVPFIIYDKSKIQNSKSKINGYNEKQIRKSKLRVKHGHELLKLLFVAC